jgi:hypothetical protein
MSRIKLKVNSNIHAVATGQSLLLVPIPKDMAKRLVRMANGGPAVAGVSNMGRAGKDSNYDYEGSLEIPEGIDPGPDETSEEDRIWRTLLRVHHHRDKAFVPTEDDKLRAREKWRESTRVRYERHNRASITCEVPAEHKEALKEICRLARVGDRRIMKLIGQIESGSL